MAEQKKEQKMEQTVDLNQLLKVRREKLAELQENGNNPFEITKYDVTNHSMEIKNNFEQFDGKTVRVAGRVMSKRVMGKASFCNVQDLEGNIQSYVARDSMGEEAYKAFKKMDIGDIIGIEGFVFQTKTGEISIHAAKVTLLTKSLQILPEKATSNWELTFRIPNTLSACYDICAVVLPRTITHPDETFKPCKFKANINYVDEKGAQQTFNCGNTQFKADPARIDTIVLAESFYFPACNYDQTGSKVSVKLQCSILPREQANYSREMYLDCIYLRPRKMNNE